MAVSPQNGGRRHRADSGMTRRVPPKRTLPGDGLVRSTAKSGVARTLWDDAGENIIEHLAALEDFEAGEATYQVAMTKSVTIQDRQDGV
jgi:hypothetical protein